MKDNEYNKVNNKRKKYRPVPLLSGVEEMRQDFEERIEQGDVKYGVEILDDAVETIRKGSLTIIQARPNCLALGTKILSRRKWVNIEDLSINDSITGIDGLEYNIIGVTRTEKIPCYKLITTDNREVISSDNHYWKVVNKKRKTEKFLTSKELFEYKNNHPKEFNSHLSIPVYQDSYTENVYKYPIHPYILGVLLGDGCLSNLSANDNVVYYCKPDTDLFNKISKINNNIYWLKDKKTVGIRDKKAVQYIVNNTLNVKSYEKYIPQEYLLAGVNIRKELLQGLLDTDGNQNKSYNEYSTTSYRLAKDIQQLAWSLGYRCTIKERVGRYKKNESYYKTRINYRVLISNTRNKSQCVIKDIIEVDERETACVTTNAPDNLIIVSNYIVTRNTGKSLLGQIIAKNLAKQGKKVLICSCEMGAALLMEREFKNLCGITPKQLRDLYEYQRDKANYILDTVFDSQYDFLKNIDICETGGATVEDLIEMFNIYNEYDYIVVDYIQRIRGEGKEYEVITNAARELQTYARQTKKALIICSQAKRASGKEDVTQNAGAQGKGSGSIEEDGDIGILLSELLVGDEKTILMTLFKNKYGSLKNITYKYRLDDRLNLILEGKNYVPRETT